MNKNHSSIFQVSDITSAELYEYGKKEPKNLKDVVFFTKNDPGHGDIYLNSYLYTYFHDIDYGYNTIYNDKFTCRLTRDRENHTLQLTYISSTYTEIVFDTDLEDQVTYTATFKIENGIENLMFDTDEGKCFAETKNGIVNISYNQEDYSCDITIDTLREDIEDEVIFTYIHNGQEYKYKIPIKGIKTNIPCSNIVINPNYAYMYDGQVINLSYYIYPYNCSHEITTFNMSNITYAGNTPNGYTVSYVTTTDPSGYYPSQTAYAYVYMIEPHIENINLNLYYTDTYLTAGNTGKIVTSIYPPEALAYAIGENGSHNLIFAVNDTPISNDYVFYDTENNLLFANFGFGNISTSANPYYLFSIAGQYKISANLSYKGQDVTSYVFYPVGIEPKKCSSIYAYAEYDPIIQSRSKYDPGQVSGTSLDLIVERKYNGLNFNNNIELQNSVPRSVDGHLEHENYINSLIIDPQDNGNNGFDNEYFREVATLKVIDNIENNTQENLTFYANDGSHNSYTVPITIKSFYVTPIWSDLNAYLLSDLTTPVESLCTNPKKKYRVISKYPITDPPASVFENIQYGESGAMSYFNYSNFGINKTNNYAYFDIIAKSYVSNGNTTKLFIQNNKASAYSILPIENEGSLLQSSHFRSSITYLGLNDSTIGIGYMPTIATNVELINLTYTTIPEIYNDKIYLEQTQAVTSSGIYYFTYKVKYTDLMFNESGIKLKTTATLKQLIDEENNEYKTITSSNIKPIPARSAILTSNVNTLDRSQNQNSILLTINSQINKYNNVYCGYIKSGDSDYTYKKLNNLNTVQSLTCNNLDISTETEYTFAVYQKINSNYLKISSDLIIPVITTAIGITNIYEIKFEETQYVVDNNNIRLRLKVDSEVNSLDNLNVILNSNGYICTSKELGTISGSYRYVYCTIKPSTSTINSLATKYTLIANTNINNSTASTLIYPKVNECTLLLTRNNINVTDVYENGTNSYNKITINVRCTNNAGTIINDSSIMSKTYAVTNSTLGSISNNIYTATSGQVGIQYIKPTINGVEYAQTKVTQYTLPTQINTNLNSISGYSGYTSSIIVTPTFRSGTQYNDYKVPKLTYYYSSNQNSIYDITGNNISGEVGNGNISIKCAYNNVNKVITISEKEITEISLPKTIYVKGNNNQFGQYGTISGTNVENITLGSLNENYEATSGISNNTAISHSSDASFGNENILIYDFGRKIGNESFSLNTNITSDQFINNSSHKLTYSQVVIPIKVTEADYITNQTANTYVYISKNPVAGTQFYQKQTATPGTPKKIFTISFNNKYFDTTTLSGHFFVHEYAKFDSMTAYNQNCKYSIWGPQNYDNIGNTYINIAAIEQDWSILRNGEYFNAGSYTTYLSVLWYDDRIRNILPSTTNIINGISNITYYNGVYDYKEIHNDGTQETYIIPLTYYMIRNNQSIKNTLDQHLLSEYTICTGQGDNTITQSKLSIYSISIDASGTGTTASTSLSNTEYISKFRTLKVTIRYMTSFPSVYNELTFTIIENGSFKSIPKNELEPTFKWWFESSSLIQPHYTMSISKIEYELTTAAGLYYDGLEINNVFIKYRTDSQLIVASSTDLGVGIGISSHTLPYAINYFNNLGCLEWPYSSWDNFMLNNHHTFYTTANTPIIKLN